MLDDPAIFDLIVKRACSLESPDPGVASSRFSPVRSFPASSSAVPVAGRPQGVLSDPQGAACDVVFEGAHREDVNVPSGGRSWWHSTTVISRTDPLFDVEEQSTFSESLRGRDDARELAVEYEGASRVVGAEEALASEEALWLEIVKEVEEDEENEVPETREDERERVEVEEWFRVEKCEEYELERETLGVLLMHQALALESRSPLPGAPFKPYDSVVPEGAMPNDAMTSDFENAVRRVDEGGSGIRHEELTSIKEPARLR
jgi:hypothetical protein